MLIATPLLAFFIIAILQERFFAMADRLATLEAQMAQLGTANSPIAIGVNASQ